LSIRAYRVVVVTKLADNPTFNLTNDQQFLQFLNEEMDFTSYLNSQWSGISEVPVSVLKKAIKVSKKLGISDNTVEQLRQDIKYAKLEGNSNVLYECF
jgi:hypothetical protein